MRNFIILLFVLFSVSSFGQTNQHPNTTAKIEEYQKKIETHLREIDTLLMINNAQLEAININTSLKNRYKLYPTENIYTFLQLDTKTGRMEQVQWSLDDDKETTFTINSSDLSSYSSYGSGTFELYPTKNMYQFLLLDKTNGRKWHVQWGIGSDKRWIKRIY